jgi:hypothetical protein
VTSWRYRLTLGDQESITEIKLVLAEEVLVLAGPCAVGEVGAKS